MARLDSINPTDQSIVGSVKISTKEDVAEAIRKAKKAFFSWRETPIEKRAAFVSLFAQEILKEKNELAKLETLEMGKPYREALADVDWDREYLDYYVEEGPVALKDEEFLLAGGRQARIIREPYGVCAVITPWNFPLDMAVWGIIPNLIAGNTAVYKPSEETPLIGQRVVEILDKVGLPKGVVNLIQGDGEIGAMLIDGPVDFVWFTGSSEVGQEIYQKCTKKFIRCLLELGGSSPGIVFADADLDKVVEDLYLARFLNCGQVCSAVKRLFIEKPIFEEFVQRFGERLVRTKIGDPFSEVDFGPLVSKKQLTILIAQVEDALEKGAKVEIGGKRPTGKQYEKGNYFLPTILTNANFNMRIMSEEVFGPVLPIVPFKSIGEVVKMANKTYYGLSAEIYTADLEKAQMVASKIEAGSIGINTDAYFSPKTPFGGYKKSGIGREGGRFGFHELTQIKYICIG